MAADNGSMIQKRGFFYAPTAVNANPTLWGVGVIELDDPAAATGSFTRTITGLTAGTSCLVAFAVNNIGISYTSPAFPSSPPLRRYRAIASPRWPTALERLGEVWIEVFPSALRHDFGAGRVPPGSIGNPSPVGIWNSTGVLLASTTRLTMRTL